MPINPHKNEKEGQFISRCMQVHDEEGKYNLKDQKQRSQALAICYAYWRRKDEEILIGEEGTTTADVEVVPVKDQLPLKKKKKCKKNINNG